MVVRTTFSSGSKRADSLSESITKLYCRPRAVLANFKLYETEHVFYRACVEPIPACPRSSVSVGFHIFILSHDSSALWIFLLGRGSHLLVLVTRIE